MPNNIVIFFGKLISKLFRLLNLGNGSTWPGHIALHVNKHFISDLLKNSQMQIIVVAGTNGKTTTASLIRHLLEADGKRVMQNVSGANLLNGIASTLLLNANIAGKLPYDFAIFEIDENILPLILKEVTPDYLVLLNLFRDQLDRYGEVHAIADKWENAINTLFARHSGKQRLHQNPDSGQAARMTKLILNADDPEIAWLGIQRNKHASYFGLNDKNLSKQTRDHAVDSVYCPKCSSPLDYKTNYYSHLGDWHCPECNLTHPELDVVNVSHYPLSGTYNKYNTHAVVLVSKLIGIEEKTINAALQEFTPAFGRQEIIEMDNKYIQIFLSKNPISFNQSLETISSLRANNLFIILNDRVADGHDVSWIWDTNLEEHINQFQNITLSGDRCYDFGLRIKYTQNEFNVQRSKFKVEPNLTDAIQFALENTQEDQTLYILPTYTAMLEVRKILTGKKIL